MTMKTQVLSLTAKEISRDSQLLFAGTPYEATIDQTYYENGGSLAVIKKPDGFVVIAHVPPEGGDSVRPAPGGEDNPNPPPLPGVQWKT